MHNGLTDRRTDQWTRPLIEMRTHLKRFEFAVGTAFIWRITSPCLPSLWAWQVFLTEDYNCYQSWYFFMGKQLHWLMKGSIPSSNMKEIFFFNNINVYNHHFRQYTTTNTSFRDAIWLQKLSFKRAYSRALPAGSKPPLALLRGGTIGHRPLRGRCPLTTKLTK